jgi:hypothetical protein
LVFVITFAAAANTASSDASLGTCSASRSGRGALPSSRDLLVLEDPAKDTGSETSLFSVAAPRNMLIEFPIGQGLLKAGRDRDSGGEEEKLLVKQQILREVIVDWQFRHAKGIHLLSSPVVHCRHRLRSAVDEIQVLGRYF